MGAEAESSILELQMISGKPRDQCIAALRAAFGNPDRAFEFLLTGVPAGAAGAGAAGAGAGGVEGSEQMADEEYGEEEGGQQPGGAGANPFAALASNPNFALIRQRIIQDPNFYMQFMQQLQQSQPQLYQMIQAMDVPVPENELFFEQLALEYHVAEDLAPIIET